mmetsp:Transcript_1481/g.3177  ORF Transcript_1481/g.3177 Transcript_1481/m.3177 type:complete len:356 (-) Transcript_1481:389-1456(-)
MSEKTIRSGTSSGFSFARCAACRIISHAASKSVEPPHGARCSCFTLSAIFSQRLRSTHCGLLSKVRQRSRNAGAESSLTSSPRPMAASIGWPLMLPLTSTSGTSFPRSIDLGSAARSAARSARPAPSPAASFTAASRVAAASAIASLVPSRSATHCACMRSASSVLSAWRPSMHLDATSCGISCFPFTAFLAMASRRCARAATRSASSGWRLPVSSSAHLPLSASFRKARRLRCRQRLETRLNSISAQRPAAMNTSVVLSATFRPATSLRYLRLDAASLAPPNSRFDSAFATALKCEPSRGAYLPARDSFGVRPSFSAAAISSPSALSCSAMSSSALLFTRSGMPATSWRSRKSL